MTCMERTTQSAEAKVRARPGTFSGQDVYVVDGIRLRHVGWYERRLPSDGKGYRFHSDNGGYGTVRTARAAVDALVALDAQR